MLFRRGTVFDMNVFNKPRLDHWSTGQYVIIICLLVFVGGQVYFTLLQREQFPFLHYGMYSQRFVEQDTQWVYNLRVGSQPMRLADLPLWKREVVVNHLDAFRSGQITKQQQQALSEWLLGYIADMRLLEEPRIEVEAVQVVWQRDSMYAVFRKKVIDYPHD